MPIWSRTGHELVYQALDNRIMIAPYAVNGDSFTPSRPTLWSDKQLESFTERTIDLAPDGKRFAVLMAPQGSGEGRGPTEVTFLLNFFDELRRRVQAAK